jgi:hypothetical protein
MNDRHRPLPSWHSSRRLRVARDTVQARLERMQERGVINRIETRGGSGRVARNGFHQISLGPGASFQLATLDCHSV